MGLGSELSRSVWAWVWVHVPVSSWAHSRSPGRRYLALRYLHCQVTLRFIATIYSFVHIFTFGPLLVSRSGDHVTHRARVCIFGLGIGGAFLVGMPESTFFIGLALVMYALYRIIVDVSTGFRWRTFCRFAVAGGLGVLIARPILTLFVEYEGLSHTVHKATNKAGLQADSYKLLPMWVAPFLNGKPLGSIVPGIAPTRNWVGAGAITLVVVSFAAPWSFLRERAALAFAGIATFFIWRMYGMAGYESVGRLPVFKLAIAPTFSSPVIAFCLAALAAIGLDAIMRSALGRVRLGAGIAILLLLATLALGWYEPVLLASNGLRVLRSIGLAFCAVLIVILAAYSARRLPLAAAVASRPVWCSSSSLFSSQGRTCRKEQIHIARRRGFRSCCLIVRHRSIMSTPGEHVQ